MKKYIILFLAFICINCSIVPIKAYDDILNEINIDVKILEDGSAQFSEKWITEVGSGTENYKVFNNMGDSKITDFTVYDEDNHHFTNTGSWNVDKTRQQKEYKCGIIKRSNSYELCWGVGKYGHREYTLQYKISNFVQQYLNDQGFNYAFLSDMDLPPQKVKIKISSFIELNDEISDIYAFGFDGQVFFQDGSVHIESSTPLSSFSKVQLLMRINDKTFKNAHETNQDYNDILEDAKTNSDYTSTNNALDYFQYKSRILNELVIVSYCAFIFIFAIAIIALSFRGSRKEKNDRKMIRFFDNTTFLPSKKYTKNIDMFRDIPCQKDIFYFYYAAMCGGLIEERQKAGLIAAILLQWVKDKQIEFVKTEDKGLLFKKAGYAIDLNVPIQTKCSVEEELLNILRQAAGENKILETNEFEKWCKKNYSKVDIWFDRVSSYVESCLTMQGMLDKKRVPYKVLFFTNYRLQKTYDSRFKEEINHVIGFKKFLEEMSSIDDKEVIEVQLWEEYLIFATILGIADEVESQLKIKCPEFNEVSYMDTIHTTRIMRDFTYRSVVAAYRAQSSASSGSYSRSSGSGGHSSSSGGGHSYSGGGGGGRR